MNIQTPISITITDRNETKYLLASVFKETPSPRDSNALDFEFEASEELFVARRAYSLNALVPVLSFIAASRLIDKAIHEYRQRQGVTLGN